MLKQHNHMVVLLMALADACAVAVAWLAAYWIRFTYLPVPKGVADLSEKFLPMLPLVVIAHLFIFYRLRLYRPRRDHKVFRETRDIGKAFIVAIVAVVLIDYAFPASNKISRRFILTYAVVGSISFALFRATVRIALHALRSRGLNRRYAAIIGTGRTAQRLLYALRRNTWTGYEIIYFVDDRTDAHATVRGVPVRGPLSELRNIVEADPVDAVFIALPTEQANRANELLSALQTSMADVRLVPELNPSYAMRPNISSLDGVPILSLRQTPLVGWNAVFKRTFDLGIGIICLLVSAVPMLLIAIAVRLTSRGPVFYRQRRMGLDGGEFRMFKFRTMKVDAEAETGAVWAKRDDSRRTAIGAFLRRTSLDELPNLFNVLAGQMSLVGPRPERPEFVEQFKNEIPRYMLRHKMKAGMTGYAQIKGYRGDTSLKKRIQHDVHYIKHWSLLLDVRILLQTLTGVWFSKHET
jgi:Undecaprenyl-phosphate glucose phosphotransferase